MVHGRTLYRDIWFDKPPLLPAVYLAGRAGRFPLRLAGALYGLLACWIAWRLAGGFWGRREAYWAAGLLGFFLIFDFPSSVTPLAADLLMLAPHLAAVWAGVAGAGVLERSAGGRGVPGESQRRAGAGGMPGLGSARVAAAAGGVRGAQRAGGPVVVEHGRAGGV